LQNVDGQQGSLGHSKHGTIVGDGEARLHDQNISKVKVKMFSNHICAIKSDF